MITTHTDRLTIRESSGRDFSRIYAMLLSECGSDAQTGSSDEKSGKTDSILTSVSLNEDEELEKYLAYIHTVYSVFGIGLCSVVLKKSGEVIGWCGLQPIGDEDSPLGRIELGYLIDKRFRSKGYAFEACRAILDFAFTRLELDEVYAMIDEKNAPSLALAGKLGFVPAKRPDIDDPAQAMDSGTALCETHPERRLYVAAGMS